MARDGSERLRFEVATQPQTAPDTTGAGDAFDAGVPRRLVRRDRRGPALPATMRQAAVAGHRAAARQLSSPRAARRVSSRTSHAHGIHHRRAARGRSGGR